MEKELQDKAWACLPKEARDKIRDIVKTSGMGIHGMFDLVFGGNVTSDTEPEEMLFVERTYIINRYKEILAQQDPKNFGYSAYNQGQKALLEGLFAAKCVPDKEPSVQGEPKFKVGNKVKIINVANPMIRDEIGLIEELPTKNDSRYKVRFEDEDWVLLKAEYLEPYTEPNSRNLSQEIANCDKSEENKLKDNMEEKELNLAELLKGCEGEKFFNPSYGVVTLKENREVIMVFETEDGGTLTPPNIFQLETGFISYYPSEESFLANPLNASKAWQEWKDARKPKRWTPQVGERIFYVNSHGAVSQDFCRSDEEGNEHQLKRRAIGNEFRTDKAAETFAKIFRETLAIFHEKNAGRDI